MFGFKFLGNTHIPHHKNTAELSPVKMPTPAEVLLPVSQHIGAPATPVVKVGDEVKVGQLIAEQTGYVSAPVHAPVSGKVVKIENSPPPTIWNLTSTPVDLPIQFFCISLVDSGQSISSRPSSRASANAG